MGNNQGKKRFWGSRVPKWIEWAQEKGTEQGRSERAHLFQKTSGGDLLREVSRGRILAIIFFLLVVVTASMPEPGGGWGGAMSLWGLIENVNGRGEETDASKVSARGSGWAGRGTVTWNSCGTCVPGSSFCQRSRMSQEPMNHSTNSTSVPTAVRGFARGCPGTPWEEVWAEAGPPRELQYSASRGENKVGTWDKSVLFGR